MKTVLTPAEWTLLQDIANRASDLQDTDRTLYLDEACAGQPHMRTRVENLLVALDSEQASPVAIDYELPAPGSRVGPYRIESIIGRGGMGLVYEAVRDDDQYRMRVAIKVASTGLMSRRLLQRFRNERQILANLDHPNVARLFDGGATASGLPYVVMELVEGRAIDDYCAERNLSVREKLALFVRVCNAVHYAHQKLVVHRDLKPGNILVTEQGEPKLLDFGIAKLLSFDPDASGPGLTAETGRMMTPGYASPEQIRDEAVTTATDVYQLGVVLYQLVTGRLPFQVGPATTLSKLELEICQRDAPKPGIDADLDGVILKAMAKEPARRYASPAEFAADIERYLGGFPVQARPASRSYIAWRFVRRHRLATATAAVFLVVIAASVIGMAVLMRRARVEAQAANQVTSFVTELFDNNDPRQGRGDQMTARQMLDLGVQKMKGEMKDSPEVRARILDTMGRLYTSLGSYEEANRLLSESVDLRVKVLRHEDAGLADSLSNMADNMANLGQLAEAERLYREALRISRKSKAGEKALATRIGNLSSVLYDEGKLQESEPLNVQALEMQKRILGPDHPETLDTMQNLETVYVQEGKYEKADELTREVLARRSKRLPKDHPDLAFSWKNLAWVAANLGRFDEAESAGRKSLEIRMKAYQGEHPLIQAGRVGLAEVLNLAGKNAEAGQLARRAMDELMKSAGEDASDTSFAKQALGNAELEQGRAAVGRKLFAEVLLARQKSMQPRSVQIGNSWMALADADMALGAMATATKEAQEADDTFRAALGTSSVFLAKSRTMMAEVAAAKGDWEQSRTLAQQALELGKANLAKDNPVVARAESDLGWALWKLGKADEAAPLLEGAYQIDREKFHDLSSPRAAARVAAHWTEFSAGRRNAPR